LAGKVPRWVERLLIPTLESRVRSVVKEELGHLEKMMNARFEGMEARFFGTDAKLDAVNAKIDSLEKRMNVVEDIVDIKARLAVVERRTSG
jgi:hypothetical protein